MAASSADPFMVSRGWLIGCITSFIFLCNRKDEAVTGSAVIRIVCAMLMWLLRSISRSQSKLRAGPNGDYNGLEHGVLRFSSQGFICE